MVPMDVNHVRTALSDVRLGAAFMHRSARSRVSQRLMKNRRRKLGARQVGLATHRRRARAMDLPRRTNDRPQLDATETYKSSFSIRHPPQVTVFLSFLSSHPCLLTLFFCPHSMLRSSSSAAARRAAPQPPLSPGRASPSSSSRWPSSPGTTSANPSSPPSGITSVTSAQNKKSSTTVLSERYSRMLCHAQRIMY